MKEQIVEVRRFHLDDQSPWIVDILAETKPSKGYVQPDGTGGPPYKYEHKADAQVAMALYLAKNAAKHLGVEASAEGTKTKSSANRCCSDCANQDDCIEHETRPADWCKDYKDKQSPQEKVEIRKFDSGATRDTSEGKLDYRKALSPIVLQRYVQYLNAHRKQPDGSMRDFDNWKMGIPIEAYFEGLGRHDMATWLLHDGFPAEDNHGPVSLEDCLCAIIFNSSGWLHEILKEKICGKTS